MLNFASDFPLHGQLTNEVQNGVTIARPHDALSRPTGYSLCASVSPCEISYSYDALGRLASVAASDIFHSPFSIFPGSGVPSNSPFPGYAF